MDLNEAADGVNVTSDEISKDLLQLAESTVMEASIVAFLGFSYNRTNLGRLGLPGILAKMWRPALYGSAFGLTKTERENVMETLNGIELATGVNCRGAFDQLRIIRDA